MAPQRTTGLLALALLSLILAFTLLHAGYAAAYSQAGNDTCACGNGDTSLGGSATNACLDCSGALGDSTHCATLVWYSGSVPVSNYSGNCIDQRFFSERTFDCGGNTLRGSGSGYGIYLPTRTGVIVQNCVIERFTTGIWLTGSQNCRLENNTLLNHTSYGIYMRDGQNNTLAHNTVLYSSYGIFVNSTAFTFTSGNVIFGNTVNYSAYNGMTFLGTTASGNNLTGNTFCANNQAASTWLDISSDANNTGNNNTCDTVYNWTDEGRSLGCSSPCSISPFQTSLYTGWNLIVLSLNV
ncbi:Periplasmic copper-binding protein (NosD) [uncultured archaeon]|nr:Periplasmic copper-binding protein (NosD) [uncultured archaeon]